MQHGFGKIGFILAALGSSIGLGHIWRFPTATGQNGGSAFVLLFLAISVFVGISMLIAEMLIGQHGRGNVVESFKSLTNNKKTPWRGMGFVLFTGPITLTFYCAVLGWVLYYLIFVSFNLPTTLEDSKAIYDAISGSTDKLGYQIACFAAVLLATTYFVVHGIKGIERLNFIIMPLLFLIFFGLLFYSMSLDSFHKSLEFMFKPDFTKITSDVIVDSMGQVFFSLSIGAGTMLTYSSHVDKKQNLLSSCFYIVIFGILISLVAGLMIFAFVFEYNGEVKDGEGLIFNILPLMFSHFGSFGNVVCALFMIGLLFAGISSTVSLLEPCVKYLQDRTGFSRRVVSYLVTAGIFIAGIFVILSLNNELGKYLTLFGKSLFSLAVYLSANILLVLGGLLGSIFIGYFIKKETLKEWTKGYFGNKILFAIWYYSIRILCPLVIVIIFLSGIGLQIPTINLF